MRRLITLAFAAALTLPMAGTSVAQEPGSPTPTDRPALGRAAATSTSPIRLWLPDEVTAMRAGRKRVYVNLGINVIAQNGDFELWSTRTPDYKNPVVTRWRSDSGTVTLPKGTMKDLSGIHRFVKIEVLKKGKVVHKRQRKACLATWDPQRVDPAAVARSPYPQSCGWNPYALGTVQGIPDGWSVRVESSYLSLKLDPGKYKVRVSLRKSLVGPLGITAADATRTARLTVPKRGHEEHAHEHRPQASTTTLRPGPRPTTAGRAPAAGTPLPDLRSLPSYSIGLNKKGTLLRFAATFWNAGESPLVVDGFRSASDPEQMDAYQYFFNADGEQQGYQQVGTMEYHGANHQHWHYEDLAAYSLVDTDRRPVRRSRKVSFCLANTDAVDLTVPGADWHAGVDDLGSMCGDSSALAVRQQLSSGHGDTYHQYRAGQAINISKIPNGTYFLKIEANPFGRLVESDTTNNVSYRRIKLSGKGADRLVRVPQLGIIDESAIEYY